MKWSGGGVVEIGRRIWRDLVSQTANYARLKLIMERNVVPLAHHIGFSVLVPSPRPFLGRPKKLMQQIPDVSDIMLTSANLSLAKRFALDILFIKTTIDLAISCRNTTQVLATLLPSTNHISLHSIQHVNVKPVSCMMALMHENANNISAFISS